MSPRWRGEGSLLVVTAYILVQTEVGKAARVAEDIVAIEGVLQAKDVTGPYDPLSTWRNVGVPAGSH